MVANWGLICNPSMNRTVTLAKDVMEFLQQQGTVWVEEWIASELHCKGSTFKEINKNAEIVITIGGDGTILMALSEVDKPVFAINSGGIGFLSEVESKYALEGLRQIISGKYNVEERARIFGNVIWGELILPRISLIYTDFLSVIIREIRG